MSYTSDIAELLHWPKPEVWDSQIPVIPRLRHHNLPLRRLELNCNLKQEHSSRGAQASAKMNSVRIWSSDLKSGFGRSMKILS